MAENAADNGVEVRIRREVVGITVNDSGTEVRSNGNGNTRHDSNDSNNDKIGFGGDRQASGGQPRFRVAVKHWEPKNVASKFLGEKHGVATKENIGIGGSREMMMMAGLVLSVGIAISSANFAFTNVSRQGVATPLASVAAATATATALGLVFALLFRGEPYHYSPSKGTVLEGIAEDEEYGCDFIVNAAGCYSDKIARMVGDNTFTIKPRTGEYILLHKEEGYKCHRTLFPTPHPFYGKGVLVQGTLWGNLILGPTARDTLEKDDKTGKYVINTAVRDEPQDNIMGYILTKCQRLVPSFDAAKVIHTFSGDRAKNTTGDWIIGPVDGVPGYDSEEDGDEDGGNN